MEWLNDVLKFLGNVPGDLWAFLPTLGLPGWLAWMPKLITGFTGLAFVTRLIPDNWLYAPITQFLDKTGMAIGAVFYATGKSISAAGKKTLGDRRWEKIETQVFEKAINLLFRAVFDGMTLFIQRIRNGWLDGLDADDPGVGKVR